MAALISECDFNNNSYPFCDWIQSKDDDGDWIRTNQQTPTEDTGPPGDYPDGTGYYIFQESGDFKEGQSTKLESQNISASTDICIEFYYHMYGICVKSQLNVLVKSAGNLTNVWHLERSQSPSWLRASVMVTYRGQQAMQIVLEAVRGTYPYCDIALDNISIKEGQCSACVDGCDFDTPDDLCGWENPVQAGNRQWEQWTGQTNVDGTGPNDDFSKPGLGYYMLMDSTFAVPKATVLLKSPVYRSYGCLTLNFHYYMYGASTSMVLNVYAAAPGKCNVQRFVIEGVYGENAKTDIAVDSVRIIPCEDVFAECDFNNNAQPFCDWIQATDDDGDWKRTNQPTPTNYTGPPGDYPAGKGYYIYQEADDFSPGQSIKLESREICTSTDMCVEFYYYMYGTVGEKVQLKVLVNNSAGQRTIWSRQGIQSPSWLLGSATVTYEAVQPVKVIFQAIRGSSPTFDIAVDNISVRKGICETCINSCDFDIQNELCGWNNPIGQNSIQWEQWTGGTETPGTGPDDDFSKPGLGFYMLMDSTFAIPGVKALLQSPINPSSGCLALRFYYYLFGTSNNVTLNVYAKAQGSTEMLLLFSIRGNQGEGWKPAEVLYMGTASIQFTIEGIFGETDKTDIAVDSVCIRPCQGTKPTASTAPNITVTTEFPRSATTVTTPPTGSSIPTKPPITSSTIITIPTGSSITTTSPTGSSTTTKPPTGSSTTTKPPTGSSTTTKPPTESSTTIRPPTGSSTTTMPPTGSSTTTMPPTGSSTTTRPPTGSSTTTRPPTGSSTTTKPPTGSSTTTRPPTGSSTTSRPPTGSSTTTRPPTGSSTTTKPPTGSSTTTRPPTGSSTTTKPPTGSSTTTKPPTGSSTTNTPPTMLSTTTKPPTGSSTTTKPPTSSSTTKTLPTMLSTTTTFTGSSIPTKPPTGTITTIKPSIGSSITTTISTGSSTIIKPPIVFSTTTIHPTVSSITTKPPTGSSITTKPPESATTHTLPTGSSTTSKPPTGSSTTTKPSTETFTTTILPTRSSTTITIITGSTTTAKPHTVSSTTSKPHSGSSTTIKPPTESVTTTTLPTGSSTTIKPPTGSSITTKHPTESSTATKPPSVYSTTTTLSTGSSTTTKASMGSSPTATTTPTPQTVSSTTFISPNGTLRTTTPFTGSSASTRTASSVPVCPPNSHYNSCGPACPPRCEAPQDSCNLPCQPGCFCNPNFVLKNKKCVPLTQCGCFYNNTYYEPGQMIWGDGCSETCRCLGNYTAECTNNSCSPTEYCKDVDGVPGCYPKDSSTCIASGDPHYTTFDKRKYDFHGNCTYVMAKPCNSTKTPFAVYASNEYRNGYNTVSYIKAVYVEVYGVVVSLLKDKIVQVDGKSVTAPINPAPGLSVFPSGNHLVVQTDFGLVVRYDGNHYAEVKITSDYQGELCGLCGNYDGAPGNDFKTPEGQQVNGINDFGNSWNVHQNCTPTGSIVTPECTEEERELYEGPVYCAILIDPDGPFAPCHKKINPNTFFKDCVYDMCELDGDKQQLCQALESYVNECQDRNITLRPWRNESFCPIKCPPNSHYESCASACPATCLNLRPQSCDRPCAEGCYCDPGFVQSGEQCVSKEQCGCHFNGQYYQPGEVIFSEACKEVCQCLANNNTMCTDTSCGPDEYCANNTGVQGCFPKGSSTCVASGDPHYTTFDKKKYDFHGNCTYVLAKPCNSTKVPFAVYASNEYRNGHTSVSYVKAIYVEVYGVVVSLLKNKVVQVNGTTVNIPINPVPGLSVSSSGKYMVVQTDFGLVVRYDGNHYSDVKVTDDYKGELCGLCGDYDGIPANDFKTPHGALVAQVNDFGNSWNVQTNCNSTTSIVVPECTKEEQDSYEGPEYCGILVDPHGPFAPCHNKINPNTFFKDCVYDMCELDGDRLQLCEALESYVNECQERNITLRPWRNESFCPIKCPPNSHYEPCASACPATCLNPRPHSCDRPCVEGCQCDPGFVQSGEQCVRKEQCGCTFNGQYYQPGEVIFSEACNEVCQCLANNNTKCTDTSCGPDEYCANNTGVQGCFPKGSSTCVASGDPHYTTFDKKKYDFHGNCTYVLAKPCNSTKVPFAVYASNEYRNGYTSVSYVKAIYVEVYGLVVSLLKNKVVQVNGTTVNIPINPVPGLSLSSSGKYMVVQTDFGLVVRYDGNHYSDVKVIEDYKGELCGLCGDYDGIPANDFKTPHGALVAQVNDFGNSWNVQTNCNSTTSIVVPECTKEEQDSYEGPEYCGILVDPHGPFAPCHNKINPNTFFKDCVYDMCELDGDRLQLCEALESYVNECQERNITLRPWRNESFCPIKCPPNSHYEPCASACPATCLNLRPHSCDRPCVEGCQCDPGFVQSGEQCVRKEQCGCTFNGQYYQPGEVIFSEACNEVCQCLANNNTKCTDTSCGPDEYCANNTGVQGCFPKGSSTCVASGDPHYTTFDKKKYDFHGNCTYVLAKPCNSTKVPFAVYASNEYRNGYTSVSYVKAIYVEVYGLVVSLLKNKVVQVNGTTVNIPINPVPGLSLSSSGKYMVVQTDFGLVVRYDGNHYSDVKVIEDYKGQLCGLCGDYDGIPTNDFKTPHGALVAQVNDFGNSWNVQTNCNSTTSIVVPECTEEEQDSYEGPEYCGILVDPHGPFAPCHNKINPNTFFKDCVYDMCELDGDRRQLCEALESYVNECQERNITLRPWRNESFCPIMCPSNSHYVPCGSACPATCLHPLGQSCDHPCIEGCQCNAGFVQSGEQCVKKEQCGCTFNGQYYQPGEVIFSEACKEVCQCLANNNTKCTDTSCGPDEYCANNTAVQGCFPTVWSTCIASGDPHYTTFDKKKYDFHGNCTYILAKPCNSTMVPFAVYASNEYRNGYTSVSYVKAIYVEAYGVEVAILKNKVVQVDRTRVNIPVKPVAGLYVSPSGKYVVVTTNFGLIVRYDGNHYADVKVASLYQGQLCGLCGDYDGSPSNDFKTSDGEVVNGVNEFGNSWNTQKNCTPVGSVVDPVCTEEERNLYEGPAYCWILVDPHGPFAACHKKISPHTFFKDCVYDMCELDGDKQQLCQALESYVNECQERNITLGPWRNETFCPIHCPPNSHYESCGLACPSTCRGPNPWTFDLPCVEGCQCNEGLVLSGGNCVPVDQCGCIYNNSYYQPGDIFYGPECSQRCECKQSNQTVCQSWACSQEETCGLLNNVYGCHPTDWASCYVSGDPHYMSFDGRLLSFMGTCTYTLASACKDFKGPAFSVEGKNEDRGQEGASYLRKVNVTVDGITITLMKSRRTLIDGRRVTLPNNPISTISISQSGQFVVVQTDFGLTVRWDGNHFLEIIVPNSYLGKVCGLCGNYDGNATNDNLKPDGSVAADGDTLGNSWQTSDDEDAECKRDETPDSACREDLYELISNSQHCGRINDTLGAFRDCIKVVDPAPYFVRCAYDMCRYEGLLETLCDHLQAYTDACLAAGATVHVWRTPEFCPLDCPLNSNYTLCASSCPPTCSGPFSPIDCPTRCVEGCECNPGFILSGKECVLAKECGCTESTGEYHVTGEQWYKKDCVEKCTCLGANIIKCTETNCRTQETCGMLDGEYGCHALNRSTCSVSGDPHYITFDRAIHHFMGNCTYTLCKVCNSSTGLPTFSVETTNEHRGGNQLVSYVKAVHVLVHGHRVTMLKNRKVIVNDHRVNLPVSLNEKVTLRLSGKYVLLQTDFGVWVRYDGNHHADVSVPSSYAGLLCGLGGNYNGDSGDDNLKPDGSPTNSVKELGESWQVPDNADCTNSGGVTEPCDPDISNEVSKPTSCGLIKDPDGPFKACHSKLPPDNYYKSCEYDLCGTNGEAASLCFALQSYADLCAQAGFNVTWRNPAFCPLNCPPDSHYESYGIACPASCTDLAAPNNCDLPNLEGCYCDSGFVFSGDKCVPFSQCGCTDSQKNYHLIGDSWFTKEDCTEKCTCTDPNNITCEASQCSPVEECKVLDGLLGCQSTGVATCHVAGDPHYFTFDNAMHTYMGTCTYTLVEVCNTSLVANFSVVAKNEERGLPENAYVRLAHVLINQDRITLQKNKRVLINDERVRTPVFDQIPGVSITTSGIYTVVETNFGLVVKFDGNHHLEIQLPGSYYNKVCGMCGNFNGNITDELLMPNGHLARNVTEFGNSWKAEGDSDPGCQPDQREDLNPKCTRDEEAHMRQLCEVMLSQTYQPCHVAVPPAAFVDNCVFDMCEYSGMITTLCDNIQSYVEACKSQGVDIRWRNQTFCPLPCPPNSHYSECSSPCPATCTNIYASASCESRTTCVEGCMCDRGFVLSDDQCVPMSRCGCLVNKNEYHNVGDTWLTKNCKTRCTCAVGGKDLCESFECSKGSTCGVKDGTNYCKPQKYDKCTVSGDPHYRTFDGFVHHYQGKHTYTLVTTHSLPESLPPLTVVGKNKQRFLFSRVSLLKEVYVDVYGQSVQLLPNRKLVVNGQKVTPPFQPHEGLKLSQKAKTIYLETDFGLSVSFDGKEHSEIVLPSTYQAHVRGLCGNYDGNKRNDYQKPDGNVVNSLNAFGDSWRVKGKGRSVPEMGRSNSRYRREVLNEDSGFEIQDCTEEQLQRMNSTEYCGALSDPQGLFKDCHALISPDEYQENCIFDLCALFNDTELRCFNYEVYVQDCQEMGVHFTPWRDLTNCSMKCPPHSTYQNCMTACPASCASLAATSECSLPCTEGCACDRGYVLSGEDCVPYSQCGSTYNNQYYPVNAHFLQGNCSQNCTCVSTGVVECHPTQCDGGNVCTVFDYTMDCYVNSPCLSDPCQNGGICIEAANGYSCQCPADFTGQDCELDANQPSSTANSSLTTTFTTPVDTEAASTVNLVAILAGVLVPVGVIILAVIAVCLYRRKASKKLWHLKEKPPQQAAVEASEGELGLGEIQLTTF
ncbi:zonadhesin [Microcaecilia unicolor]|uniref:Zonadhesin n=1 Tax=Microcaecilia unicolor TaxID=1415580 RepID=A0A6P7WUD3_9AMPH|nr:zonadhesin-like [Microcaecilia unicolor]